MVLLDELRTGMTVGEFIALMSLLALILGGVISQWIWMRSRLAEYGVRILEVETKLTKKDEDLADERKEIAKQAALNSREVTSTFTRVFEKLDDIKDELKDDISKINVLCAGHEARTRDTVIKILKDHDIIKSRT